MIKGIALDWYPASATDHLLDTGLGQLILISLRQIRLHQGAALVNRSVKIVSTNIKNFLGVE